MANVNRNGTPLTEDQARRVICTHLATLLQRGSCTVRIRRLNDEQRVTFLAEVSNKWEPAMGMDYQGRDADQIIDAILAVGNKNKRGKDVRVSVQSSGNHDDVTVGFHKEAVSQHRGNLYQYVFGQLFWD